jgi:hypothetical protein
LHRQRLQQPVSRLLPKIELRRRDVPKPSRPKLAARIVELRQR